MTWLPITSPSPPSNCIILVLSGPCFLYMRMFSQSAVRTMYNIKHGARPSDSKAHISWPQGVYSLSRGDRQVNNGYIPNAQ